MGNKLNKGLILDRLKSAFNLSGNSELARFLGVAPNTITNWYNRNSIDFDIILPKCENLNLNWLFTGTGPIHKNEKQDRPDYGSIDSMTLINGLIDKVEGLSALLGKQTKENEYLHRKNMELQSDIDDLKKIHPERVVYLRRDTVHSDQNIASEPEPEGY